MQSLICIICPIGCSLEIENNGLHDNLSVTGNRCPRGVVYAQEEIRSPKRVVTATAPIMESCIKEGQGAVRRVPVKTSSPCPKEKIPTLLRDIYKVKVSLPVKIGDVIIAGWDGEDINVVVTRSIG